MENNYNPTIKEITTEMFKKFGKEIKDFGVMAGCVGGFMISMPYAVPSYVRWINESNEIGELTNAEVIGGILGCIGGIVIDAGQLSYYLSNESPKIVAIPAITNIASGLYEVARYGYKKAKQNLIEKHNLESSVLTNE